MKWSASRPLFLSILIAFNGLIVLVCHLTSWKFAGLFFLNFLLSWGYWLILAWALRDHLARLGYGVWPVVDRIRLALRCQMVCRRLPLARDLQKALGTDNPIDYRALANALLTIARLEGKAGRFLR